ncbi:MAG: hypothetical protein J1F14_00145 [Treponema sp.]|nr:hypothetical protein [Treponema sp.]
MELSAGAQSFPEAFWGSLHAHKASPKRFGAHCTRTRLSRSVLGLIADAQGFPEAFWGSLHAHKASPACFGAHCGRGPRVGLSFGSIGGFDETLGLLQLDWLLSWAPWLYSGPVFDFEFNDYLTFGFIGTIGVNWGIPLGHYRPVIYSDFGIGVEAINVQPSSKIKNPPSDFNLEDNTEAKFALRYALGIEFPFGEFFRINLQYALKHMPDYSHTPLHQFTLGMHMGFSVPFSYIFKDGGIEMIFD